ncbi:unnamed protein product [Triticum turgidum subsp. durum]|uniref:Uncharacterized protein n=1 Tax=Triticum turgidum subsp. durum TaxID=4567 RepID=A0A9R0TMI0_TRITD|nr:unnamed protein product [Triticum turgidum subsp. durum]
MAAWVGAVKQLSRESLTDLLLGQHTPADGSSAPAAQRYHVHGSLRAAMWLTLGGAKLRGHPWHWVPEREKARGEMAKFLFSVICSLPYADDGKPSLCRLPRQNADGKESNDGKSPVCHSETSFP